MRITVHVIPRSKHNILTWESTTGDADTTNQNNADRLKAHLTAPPVDGAANEALIALLAERLKIPRRTIHIVQGATGRRKVVEISHLTLEELRERLTASHQR